MHCHTRRLGIISGLAFSLLAAACSDTSTGGTDDTGDTQITHLSSSLSRETRPEVGSDVLAALVEGNTAFAFDLYGLLRDNSGDLFYSPYSISLALAMLYGGARDETETQMAEAMHFTLGQDQLHPAFNRLDLILTSRGEGAMGQDGEPFRLRIANSIWGQVDYSFQQAYLDLLARNYGAGMNLLDFQTEPEPSRITINDWVADSTEGKIENLLPPGSITTLTRLVLTNAIYFNAAWENQFEESATAPDTFTTAEGANLVVPFMNQTDNFGYLDGDGFEAVELPYDGYELSMVMVVPDEGRFASFESTMDAGVVSAIVDSMGSARLALSMPKFTIAGDGFSVKAVLQTLGMQDAFVYGTANLSGIDGTRNLYVTDVVHKAFVAVDEKGTEAAAATGVIVGTTAMPPPPIPVAIDRPFVFMIRDIETEAILFVGRVVEPTP